MSALIRWSSVGLVWLGAAALVTVEGQVRRPFPTLRPISATTTHAAQLPVAARPERAERPVPFKVGETLEYDVSWSALLIAGTATLRVQEKKPSYGSTAYYIYAEGKPTPLIASFYPVYYKLDTLLDAYTLLPQRGATYSDERGRRKMMVAGFNRSTGTVDYEVRTSTTTRTRLTVPPLTQDALSALMIVRAAPLLQGGRITMPILDGGVLYTMKMTVGAKEQVATSAGLFRAWHLSPVLTDTDGRQAAGGLAIWISDDPRRLPVRMEGDLPVGRFVLRLRKVVG